MLAIIVIFSWHKMNVSNIALKDADVGAGRERVILEVCEVDQLKLAINYCLHVPCVLENF